MNPWPILLAVILFLAGFLAGLASGWKLNDNHRDALDLAEFKGKSEALDATAREIAKIDVRNVTIRQKVETQIKEIPIYRECKNTPEVMTSINEALKGGAK